MQTIIIAIITLFRFHIWGFPMWKPLQIHEGLFTLFSLYWLLFTHSFSLLLFHLQYWTFFKILPKTCNLPWLPSLKCLATSPRYGQSMFPQWTWIMIWWLNLFLVAVFLKKALICFSTGNYSCTVGCRHKQKQFCQLKPLLH